MDFANPGVLLLLLFIPPLVLLFVFSFRQRKRVLLKIAAEPMLGKITSADEFLPKLKALFLIGALVLMILSAARPRFGSKLVEVTGKASDVVIAVDVSRSMLAEDLKPNRLEKAKGLLSILINQLSGNRVGVVAFAGTAFWQCPLTLDIASANLFLEIMDANLIPLPGTSIGSAIRLGLKGLSGSVPGTKAIVLLTDGEDHDSDPEGAAVAAQNSGVKIFTIGFGNPNGEPIPDKDENGTFTGYKKNKRGEVVMSKMDETLLLKIAAQTGGEYFRAQDGNVDITRLIDGINGLEKKKAGTRLNRQLEDRYQYFLLFGLLLLLAEYFIPLTRKNK